MRENTSDEPDEENNTEAAEESNEMDEPEEPVMNGINLYEPVSLGTRFPLENDELQDAFRRLWNRESTKEI